MKISNWKKISLIDYPGKISTIIFFSECNYQCPACHAKNLLESKETISEKEILDYIEKRNSEKKIIEGVVFCGGEPTLQKDLFYLAEKIKEKNLAIKLDTNGSNPKVLEKLLKKNFVDYVAMDVKGPENLYSFITGKKIDINKIKESINLVSQFPYYEFRTTIVPIIKNDKTCFMTPEEIGETAKLIYNCTGDSKHKYFLQPFLPHKGENALINSKLENFSETPKEILEKGKDESIKYLPNTEIR